jgi:hypothetical protein
MQELDSRLSTERFDLILCMGNSLPHLLTAAELHNTLNGFHARLAANGHAFLHLLNYTRVLEQKERVVGISRSEDGQTEYLRFYDFEEELLRFNVLRMRWAKDGNATHDLRTTTLRPWREAELRAALNAAGFSRIRTFADFAFSPFAPEQADILLFEASARL